MRTFKLIILLLGFSLSALSQIDKSNMKKEKTYYSNYVLVGTWQDADGNEYSIDRTAEGRLVLMTSTSLKLFYLVRSGPVEYSAFDEDVKRFILVVKSDRELRVLSYDEEGVFIDDKTWTFMAEMSEVDDSKSSMVGGIDKVHRPFILAYPSLHSPFALYAGFLSNKLDLYIGVRISSFYVPKSEVNHNSEGESLSFPEGQTTTYTGINEIAHSSFVLGFTHHLKNDKWLMHYGFGYGNYKEYKAFDTWELDQNKKYRYQTTVWALDNENNLTGIQTEIGIIYDAGIIFSTGISLINFKKADFMLGIGYSF